MVGLIASAIAILIFVSGKHSVGEFQHSSADDRQQEFAPSTVTRAAYNIYVRVSNCDDGGRAILNDMLVTEVGFGEDSGWVNVSSQLRSGGNRIKFQVLNDVGAITYGFQVRKNEEILFDVACGEHHKYGCEGNRQDFPIGIAREFVVEVMVN
jgi:hypothetical protein